MPSRLPISLAQLKAGNNSKKLKNEIRQLLYSLYGSKELSKTIYKLKIVRQMSLTIFFMNLLTSLILKVQIKILHWLI